MIKGTLYDDKNKSYNVTIESECDSINVYDFYDKYVFTYEIKRLPGKTYYTIFRYILNRYKEYLDLYFNWVPCDKTCNENDYNPAVFTNEEYAKEKLDELVKNHKYGIDPKPNIFSY